MDALRLYLRYLGLSIRGQLQYRATFLIKTSGHAIVTAIEFLGLWALFARFGSIGGWSLAEVGLLYGIVDVAFALAEGLGRGFDMFARLLKAGDFDRLLLRPRSTVLQLLGQELHLMRLGRLVQGLAVLCWAGSSGAIAWGPFEVLVLALAVAGTTCVFLGLVVLQATSAFWTIETLEVWNAFSFGGNYAAQHPLSIFRPWFRLWFLAVVPLGCTAYAPALAILARPDPLDLPPVLGPLGPLAGAAFLALALAAWGRLGLRHYASTGS